MSIICTHAPWGLLDVDHRPKTTFLRVRTPWAHPPIYQFMICTFYTVHANHLNYMDICRIAKRWFTSRSAQARSHKISIVFCNVIFSRRWEIFLVPLTSYRYINCTGRGREWNGEEASQRLTTDWTRRHVRWRSDNDLLVIKLASQSSIFNFKSYQKKRYLAIIICCTSRSCHIHRFAHIYI